jgi:uncharacterized protein (DUF924 family)
MRPERIIDFWFTAHGEDQWFTRDPKFDAAVKKHFLKTYEAVAAGEAIDWRADPLGRLAEIIVLDQFARNMFRDSPRAFALDPKAHVLAQEALRMNADKVLDRRERRFFYMPFMHSESRVIQKRSVELVRVYGDKAVLKFALEHKKIIDRFGRFPHRNSILGRKSTAVEKDFLKTHKGF